MPQKALMTVCWHLRLLLMRKKHHAVTDVVAEEEREVAEVIDQTKVKEDKASRATNKL